MTLWRLLYHFVWSTKHRQPRTTTTIEAPLYRSIEQQVHIINGVFHAIGGIENHVHLAVSVPPTLALAQFVKQIKGSSAHYINHVMNTTTVFRWQRGYGVLSFDEPGLATVVQYIRQQKHHHRAGTLIDAFERGERVP